MSKLANIYQKLKQQKWTHIVAPFYLLYTLTLTFAIVAYLITDDFSYPYLVILIGACLYPFLLSITFIVFILLKILSFKFKNINKISNKFFLHNVFYNILWFLSIITLIIGSIVFAYNILKIYI